MRLKVLIVVATWTCLAADLWADLPSLEPQTAIARDLAQALLIHDQSIRTLRWTQVVRLNAGRPDELEHLSHHIFDTRGRWRCKFEKVLLGAEDGERITLKGAMFYDGSRLVGRDDTSHTGAIREYTGERRSEVSLDCWLGRHLDITHGRRLGELLLTATDLEVSGCSDRGLPVIAGTADLTPMVALLEVEVDPEHGFAPRSITVRDRLILVPYFRYEVQEFRLVDDVWIPTSGTLDTRQYQPSAEQAREMAELLQKRGLARDSNGRDARVQASFKEVLRHVFGAEEAPSTPLVPRIAIEASRVTVNQEIPEEEFAVEYPRAYMVLDAFRDLLKPAHSEEWVENPKGY